ncbi:MAG: hypothetical protein FJ077_15635 [Cyanobacteria bacterium K_DeepCast_35m_m2_023]|nr:hypothetical protein [Cyanobacteria bacterium K_DeepCast_35m_m2_023]
MNRSAADVIRHLQARIARLEGRTAAGGSGPNDISAPPEDAAKNVRTNFSDFLYFYGTAVTDLQKRKKEVLDSTSELVLQSEEREEFLSLMHGLENGSLKVKRGGPNFLSSVAEAIEAAHTVGRLYSLLNRLSVLSGYGPDQLGNTPLSPYRRR